MMVMKVVLTRSCNIIRQTLDYDITIHWMETMQVTLTLELSLSDQNNFEANQYILAWYSGNVLYHRSNVFLLFLYVFYHKKLIRILVTMIESHTRQKWRK